MTGNENKSRVTSGPVRPVPSQATEKILERASGDGAADHSPPAECRIDPTSWKISIQRSTCSPSLRGPEIGGTASCTVIDVRDNIVGFGDADRIYQLFEEY